MARKKPETQARELSSCSRDEWRTDAYNLALNIIFIREKLKQARELIANTAVVIPYQNGPNQSGVRENPAFKGYEALLKTYCTAIKQLDELIDKQGGSGEGGTVADIMAEAMGFKLAAKK